MQRSSHFLVLYGLCAAIVAGLLAFAFSGVGAFAVLAGVAGFFLVLHAAYGPDDDLEFVPVARRSTPTPSRKASTRPAPAAEAYRPQCGALRNDGIQCRNSSRKGSNYCSSHFGYQPRTPEGVVRLTDTASKVARVDTPTSYAGDAKATTTKGAQCQALTATGRGTKQCKNTVRPGSQFCVAHQGYRSPTPQGVVRGRDSQPRVPGAPDTRPSVRRRSAT